MTPAELIEAALRQHFALRLKLSAIEQAQRGHPLWLSGAQAEDAARIAVDALAGAGYSLVRAVRPDEEAEDNAMWAALPERTDRS